jgi:hypothetical protein
VGRAPLDEQAIRLIEEHNPDIRFDWNQILKGEDESPARHEHRPGRDREPQRSQQREHRPAPRPHAPAPPPPAAQAPDQPISAAHEQLGSEGLARLRARYADVMNSIATRVADVERREQLNEAAARLNPDNWVTPEEVRSALEQYEATLESFRDVLGRKRRRRRGRGSPGAEGGPDDRQQTEATGTDEAGSPDASEPDDGDAGAGDEDAPG